jgi:uncharacterized protein (TIGR03086 family)
VDPIATLDFGMNELRRQVAALPDAQLETVSNCDPWTVRQLASHALNNQMLWGGLVTGEPTVSVEETMGGVPHDGDLEEYADAVADRSLKMWRTEGVMDDVHATPFGELPGSVVINFPTIDAVCHAWDLATSVGQPLEFPPEMIPAISAVVAATCTDAAREHGLIKDVAPTPPDATDTERLMAQAGRTPRR